MVIILEQNNKILPGNGYPILLKGMIYTFGTSAMVEKNRLDTIPWMVTMGKRVRRTNSTVAFGTVSTPLVSLSEKGTKHYFFTLGPLVKGVLV